MNIPLGLIGFDLVVIGTAIQFVEWYIQGKISSDSLIYIIILTAFSLLQKSTLIGILFPKYHQVIPPRRLPNCVKG